MPAMASHAGTTNLGAASERTARSLPLHLKPDLSSGEAQFFRMSQETKDLLAARSSHISYTDRVKARVSLTLPTIPATVKEKEAQLNKIIGAVIMLNVFMIGLELDLGPSQDAPLKDRAPWYTVEVIILMIFISELAARIHWERRRWPRSLWNWFDLVIVISGLFEAIVLPFARASTWASNFLSLIRIIRLARLVRFIKLMKVFRGLYLAITSFKVALMHIIHICLMMLGGIYVSAIIMTGFVGHREELSNLQMGAANGRERFGTMSQSIYSLFELMTLEGWELTGRPLMMNEPVVGLFICLFIMIFSFGLLNMLLAMVVQMKVAQAKQMRLIDHKANMSEMVAALETIFKELDDNEDGMLSKDELHTNIMEHPRLAKCLNRMEMSLEDVAKLFQLLQVNGAVRAEEFLEGCVCMKGAGHDSWNRLALQASCKGLHHYVERLKLHFHELRPPRVIVKDCSSGSVASDAEVVPLTFAQALDLSTARRGLPVQDDPISPASQAASASIMSASNRSNSGGSQRGDLLRALSAAASANEETHRQILRKLESCEKKVRNRRLQSPAESSTEI